MIKFICYPRCTTCQRAKKWLDDNKIEYAFRDIKLDNPTAEELAAWYEKSGLPLKKLFNTSGLLYKSLDLKNKLPTMSEAEMLALLASDGSGAVRGAGGVSFADDLIIVVSLRRIFDFGIVALVNTGQHLHLHLGISALLTKLF